MLSVIISNHFSHGISLALYVNFTADRDKQTDLCRPTTRSASYRLTSSSQVFMPPEKHLQNSVNTWSGVWAAEERGQCSLAHSPFNGVTIITGAVYLLALSAFNCQAEKHRAIDLLYIKRSCEDRHGIQGQTKQVCRWLPRSRGDVFIWAARVISQLDIWVCFKENRGEVVSGHTLPSAGGHYYCWYLISGHEKYSLIKRLLSNLNAPQTSATEINIRKKTTRYLLCYHTWVALAIKTHTVYTMQKDVWYEVIPTSCLHKYAMPKFVSCWPLLDTEGNSKE